MKRQCQNSPSPFSGRMFYEAIKPGFSFLWPPCVADADIVFLSCFFLFFLA